MTIQSDWRDDYKSPVRPAALHSLPLRRQSIPEQMPSPVPSTGSIADRPSIPIFAGGRHVGDVVGNVFKKRVRGSCHRLKKPPAWASDIEALDQAEAVGAAIVEIWDVESGIRYTARIATIRSCGFRFDRGHGPQLGLGLAEWTTKPAGPGQCRSIDRPS